MAVKKNISIPRPRSNTEVAPAVPSFSIVGIGASAGGLEAFEQFLRHVPPDCGMAFVLVSHLDPSHVSILTEILQRSTAMPVVEAQDQLQVMSNHVYVIPPNRDMAIFHGSLQLSMPESSRGQRMPISPCTSPKMPGATLCAFSILPCRTGYSSLSYLTRLPLDQLKIDQSFIRDIGTDPNGATIVQTIIIMGQTLRLNVIAEGVETEAQRDFLGSKGCHSYQGYLFSRPLPLAEFEQFMKLQAKP